jgi:hypothetical protein
VLEPGPLTRDYLEGKRAPQIPPFRLFLTMLLILFLVGSVASGNGNFVHAEGASDADRAAVKAEIAKTNMDIHFDTGLGASTNQAIITWLKVRVPLAIEHPEALIGAMGEWAHRFAFITLPISALLLSIIFAFRRNTYLFDHLIFSMHSLSFQGLLLALVMGTSNITGGAAGLLFIASPVHLYAHMRDTYGTSATGTIQRMIVLFLASSVAFALLLLGLVVLDLNALPA